MTKKPRTMALDGLETVPLDKIKPYWRNPRRISDDAVETVRRSIEAYGYRQPIVVDDEYVIIVGHTRYAALRRLGVPEIPVLVARHLSERKVKEYRLIDNRSAEFTSWDIDVLVEELSALDEQFAATEFSDVVDAGEFLTVEDKARQEWDQVVPETDLVCPHCWTEFKVNVKREIVLGGVIPATEAKAVDGA